MRTITSTGQRKKTSWVLDIGSNPKLIVNEVARTETDEWSRLAFGVHHIPTTDTLIKRFKEAFPNQTCNNGYDVYGAAAFDEQVVDLISKWFIELVTVLTAIHLEYGGDRFQVEGGISKRTDFLPTIRRTCRALESHIIVI